MANLGQFVSEQELKDVFGTFAGFSRLRMHNKGGSPVAFVEYQVSFNFCFLFAVRPNEGLVYFVLNSYYFKDDVSLSLSS